MRRPLALLLICSIGAATLHADRVQLRNGLQRDGLVVIGWDQHGLVLFDPLRDEAFWIKKQSVARIVPAVRAEVLERTARESLAAAGRTRDRAEQARLATLAWLGLQQSLEAPAVAELQRRIESLLPALVAELGRAQAELGKLPAEKMRKARARVSAAVRLAGRVSALSLAARDPARYRAAGEWRRSLRGKLDRFHAQHRADHCESCQGAGLDECVKCDGQGYTERLRARVGAMGQPLPPIRERTTHSECRGWGLRFCSRCRGTGFLARKFEQVTSHNKLWDVARTLRKKHDRRLLGKPGHGLLLTDDPAQLLLRTIPRLVQRTRWSVPYSWRFEYGEETSKSIRALLTGLPLARHDLPAELAGSSAWQASSRLGQKSEQRYLLRYPFLLRFALEWSQALDRVREILPLPGDPHGSLPALGERPAKPGAGYRYVPAEILAAAPQWFEGQWLATVVLCEKIEPWSSGWVEGWRIHSRPGQAGGILPLICGISEPSRTRLERLIGEVLEQPAAAADRAILRWVQGYPAQHLARRIESLAELRPGTPLLLLGRIRAATELHHRVFFELCDVVRATAGIEPLKPEPKEVPKAPGPAAGPRQAQPEPDKPRAQAVGDLVRAADTLADVAWGRLEAGQRAPLLRQALALYRQALSAAEDNWYVRDRVFELESGLGQIGASGERPALPASQAGFDPRPFEKALAEMAVLLESANKAVYRRREVREGLGEQWAIFELALRGGERRLLHLRYYVEQQRVVVVYCQVRDTRGGLVRNYYRDEEQQVWVRDRYIRPKEDRNQGK